MLAASVSRRSRSPTKLDSSSRETVCSTSLPSMRPPPFPGHGARQAEELAALGLADGVVGEERLRLTGEKRA